LIFFHNGFPGLVDFFEYNLTIETSRKAYSIAESSAENGLITQLDLRDTRVYLDQAALNYYMAVFDYLNAYFDWQQAAGQKGE